MESGETEEETAQREVWEETGIDIMIDTSFRETVSYSPKKDTMKEVVYFLAMAKNFNYTPQPEEISQIRWVEISLAHQVLSYDNDRQLVNKARPVIKGSYGKV